MANNGRVTASEVTTNFDTDLTDAEIDGWVNAATELVDDIADADSSIDNTRLKQIELALTRHFASAQDPRLEGYSVGGSSGSYQVELGEMLKSTTYGQQALLLDKTEVLSGSQKPAAGLSIPNVRGITSDERD